MMKSSLRKLLVCGLLSWMIMFIGAHSIEAVPPNFDQIKREYKETLEILKPHYGFYVSGSESYETGKLNLQHSRLDEQIIGEIFAFLSNCDDEYYRERGDAISDKKSDQQEEKDDSWIYLPDELDGYLYQINFALSFDEYKGGEAYPLSQLPEQTFKTKELEELYQRTYSITKGHYLTILDSNHLLLTSISDNDTVRFDFMTRISQDPNEIKRLMD